MCGGLGAEVHRLALQLQVLEESDTMAQEAEAVGSCSCSPTLLPQPLPLFVTLAASAVQWDFEGC